MAIATRFALDPYEFTARFEFFCLRCQNTTPDGRRPQITDTDWRMANDRIANSVAYRRTGCSIAETPQSAIETAFHRGDPEMPPGPRH